MYIVLPVSVTAILMGMYFSGIGVLQSIVAPMMPEMNFNLGREMGLVENLQNVCLLVMTAMALRGVAVKDHAWERYLFLVIACGSLFILLEEIDYGRHYYELIMGIRAHDSAAVRNIHNVGRSAEYFWYVADVLIVGMFILAPFALRKVAWRPVRYLLPSRWCAVLAIFGFLSGRLAALLDGWGFAEADTLKGNTGEFMELIYYYMFTLYVHELVFRRRYTSPHGTTPGIMD